MTVQIVVELMQGGGAADDERHVGQRLADEGLHVDRRAGVGRCSRRRDRWVRCRG